MQYFNISTVFYHICHLLSILYTSITFLKWTDNKSIICACVWFLSCFSAGWKKSFSLMCKFSVFNVLWIQMKTSHVFYWTLVCYCWIDIDSFIPASHLWLFCFISCQWSDEERWIPGWGWEGCKHYSTHRSFHIHVLFTDDGQNLNMASCSVFKLMITLTTEE